MAQSREMTSGPSLPLILNFTFPLLLGNLLQQTYSLVDAAIVGKLLGIGQSEAGGGDVGSGGHCHQSALRIYPAFHAHTGEYL